ncbi:MAG: DUF3500 domain-containing protein [Verrucomicrobiota bacterium]|nr:DUF3500 domain-containing protein [Verrucomicrobiota bacterium]
MKSRLLCCLAILFFAARTTLAHSAAEEMAESANHFLAALTTEQREKAVFPLASDERLNWHFIPKERKGLSFAEMNPAQSSLGYAMLSSAMSHRGFMKATAIMSLEQILFEIEQNRGPKRDAERYFISIFGTPGEKNWGWRFEGHHLSLNFTIVNGEAVASTPSFMGSNPGEVRSGPRKGLRVLGNEEELARKLVKSLSEKQLKVALFTNTAPADIITAADRKARPLEPKGIALKALNKEQKTLFWATLEEYVRRTRAEIADEDLATIRKAGADQLFFGWAGSTEPGQPHYYRIQGPTFLLEYDNTQNDANHVHAVYRDLKNDFGLDLLGEHYKTSHQ